MSAAGDGRVPLVTIAKSWSRIGCLGFGGPPAHIGLLRQLCVSRREWLSAQEFNDAVSATNLLPGPASTQLAIWCAWRLRGPAGALIGGVCFIFPGLVLILALAAAFLAASPPLGALGAAAGAGAAIPAVAVHTAGGLLPAAWARMGPDPWARARASCFLVAGGVAAATAGAGLVLVLVASGLVEIAVKGRGRPGAPPSLLGLPLVAGGAAMGGLGAVAWVGFKVGALSYGGGFVIVPLMQHDAVNHYHWMSGTQFLGAVALGQITPGPVVQTVAVVGYAAAGVGGGLLAAVIAFAPSFAFVLAGARHFGRLRSNASAQSFLRGAALAAVGAIAGAAIPLAGALQHLWQAGILVAAGASLLVLRRSLPTALIGAGAIGAVAAILGAPVGR